MLVSHRLEQMLALGCPLSPDIFPEHLQQSGDPGAP